MMIPKDQPQNEDNSQTFEEIVKPVMVWLAKHKHPHTCIFIETTRAELLEGVEAFSTEEFLRD